MIERVEETTDNLLNKHTKERLALQKQFSDLYGVNFKYVKTTELIVPLEKILEYREDAKKLPIVKETFLQKLDRKTIGVRYNARKIWKWFF